MKREILITGLLSYESPKYWELCRQSIEATVSSSTNIKYLIGFDRVDKATRKKLISYLPGCHTCDVSIYPPETKKETTHDKRVRIGKVYNKLFSHIPDASKYVFMLDGDICFVQKDWDEILLNELDDHCITIGHEYSKRWPEKYQGFPCVQCALFDFSKVKDLGISFEGSSKTLTIETSEQSRIFGLKKGQKLNRDIGWEWPLRIKKAGYSGKCLSFLPGDHKLCQLLRPDSKDDHKVYKQNERDGIKSLFELHWDGKVIGTHLTKSTCLAFNKHPVCKFWIKRVRDRIS